MAMVSARSTFNLPPAKQLTFMGQHQRPSSIEARIPPSAMGDHRITHRMLGPCCLCPMLDANKPDFIKAAIYMASAGEWQAGKYVATCAKDECGYSGEGCTNLSLPTRLTYHQAPLESLYDRPGPIHNYARRGQSLSNHYLTINLTLFPAIGEGVPPIVRHVSETRLAAPAPAPSSRPVLGAVTSDVCLLVHY
jgi:hypothetical protein